jgi:hypothetical protein
MPTRFFHVAWVVWALVGLFLEIWALHDKETGDTLTEQVRWVVSHPFMWWIGIGLAAWTFGHFFLGWK